MYVVEQEREVIIVADLPGVEKENVEISLVYPRTDRDHARENGMKTLERGRSLPGSESIRYFLPCSHNHMG